MATLPAIEFPQFAPEVAEHMTREDAASASGITAYLGVRHTEVGAGILRAEVEVRDELLNPAGNLHGGVIAALCDHVLGAVCYPVIAPGSWAATTEFKLNYLAPVSTGTLTATAQIEALTKRTAVVRIDVVNEGRAVCIAQGTVLIMAPRPK
jgi:uncharacterized protein (TIGR00369 family)